jgi:hypothetical protein
MGGMRIDMHIRVDKGVTYSAMDEAWVAYKKNHFQLTYNITMSSPTQ